MKIRYETTLTSWCSGEIELEEEEETAFLALEEIDEREDWVRDFVRSDAVYSVDEREMGDVDWQEIET